MHSHELSRSICYHYNMFWGHSGIFMKKILWWSGGQCLSQDLETGCLKLAIVKFWGVHIL